MNVVSTLSILGLTTVIAGCQQAAERGDTGAEPLIAVAGPMETTNAALSVGRFSLEGRCLVFVTSDGLTYLPVFGRPVAIAGQGRTPQKGAAGTELVLGRVYSVTGSPFPEGMEPDGLASEIRDECFHPPFAVGLASEGVRPSPPPPPPSG